MVAGRQAGRDEGFTLIELMIVVLIVAILLAIAIPAFLGARTRASDRSVQSNIRNALTTQLVFYSDGQLFTDSTTALHDLDPQITWSNDLTQTALSPQIMYVKLVTVNATRAVVIGGKSAAGQCFWIRAVHDQNQPRFAENDCAAPPPEDEYSDSW
jgi:type IV pilus assembly protein PilA